MSPTTTTTSRKLMFRHRTLTLPRTLPSTMRSTSCATLRQQRFLSGRMSSLWHSVSCIYGLGSPIDYQEMVISLRPGMIKTGMRFCRSWLRSSMTAMIWISTAERSGCEEMWLRSFRRIRNNCDTELNFSVMR